ncbi:hypothetical protein CP10139811_0335 [Chlamydia ibidis]|uniref:HD/PDEase domain-containing protein n=2 Tax=Chlamydia ibidis TaxID=1405396 RepID=S7KIX1_9CHLA|nr:HDIG domain-containing metalloprotein [Chlamydia ibidis]EPP34360.1 hypothetical protein CP10139811_0335 [Chlamydia ibidis]EQM62946.1 hypothetical protein H359_0420 [Chlamydia ibidis 10-1398/6]
MKDFGRVYSNCSKYSISSHLRYLIYFGISGSFGLALFAFVYLKVLYIPMYSEGQIAHMSVVSPIDFQVSWNTHTFYSKVSSAPEAFGKVYKITTELDDNEKSADIFCNWFAVTKEFLNTAGFVDVSTYRCLTDLRLHTDAINDGKFLEVQISKDQQQIIRQCILHLEDFLSKNHCPNACKERIISHLRGSKLRVNVDKSLSGYIQGDLLGSRRSENFPRGTIVIQKYQKITAKDVKILRQLRSDLFSSTQLFILRSEIVAFFLMALALFWGYRSLKLFCPELLASSKYFMLYIAILTLSLVGVKTIEVLCALGPHSWVTYLSYPLVLPFTSILLGHLVGIPLAGVSCTFLGILYTLESDIWNNSWFLAINLLSSWMVLFTVNRVMRLASVFWFCMKLWWISLGILSVFRVFGGIGSWHAFQIDCVSSFIYSFATAVGVVALIPVFESFFGACTHNHLLAYLDSDYPLLKRLFEQAPGTYQHSVLVGILAEAAAAAIHADGLFCRVAAQYHDIGKLVNPEFFIENHQMLKQEKVQYSPLEQAKKIIRHIPEGVELAKKAGLPDSFINIIEEHHGTSTILSAYHSHLQENPVTGPLDEPLFRYSGRKPCSKESTIIMIADSFEAAARSLEGTSVAALRELIDKIVLGKMRDGQFAESPVTLDELTTICDVMVKTLYSALHSRIKYPELTYTHGSRLSIAGEVTR